MVSERDDLSGDEIVLHIEALDALIPFREDTAYTTSAEERARWAPYSGLRRRLKEAVRMSFYDTSRGWLDTELQRERTALTDRQKSWWALRDSNPGPTD
jgi:hypothetical protein